ncbi:hypothetical protein [Thermopirellula anaerolimosa]
MPHRLRPAVLRRLIGCSLKLGGIGSVVSGVFDPMAPLNSLGDF